MHGQQLDQRVQRSVGLVLWLLLPPAACLLTNGGCDGVTVTAPGLTVEDCWQFDLRTLPDTQNWTVHDDSSYKTAYEVAAPCKNLTPGLCANSVAASPAYALIGKQGGKASTCYALGGAAAPEGGGLPTGSLTATLPEATDDTTPSGLSITIPGGEGGRTLVYNLLCDATAPVSQGPDSMNWSHSQPLVYPVVWRHPAGCGKQQTGSRCPAPPKPPLPTKVQLAYQEAEIVAIVCFQMDTYAGTDGDPGCNPSNWNKGVKTSSPATFKPTALNVSQWVEVGKAMGAKMSWLTAKHGCGFLLWPTKTRLPDGRPYNYDVGASTAGTHVDIVKQWMDLNRAAGIGPGLYYSLKDNYYLNSAAGGLVGKGPLLPGQENVSQAEYEAIELAQLTELWSEYGTLAETWFDGGWAPDMLPALKRLIAKYLPNTAAFGGLGVTPNAVKWVGTEEPVTLAGPTWSTGNTGQGDPDAQTFVPAGCDTVMLTPHHWFMGPPSKPRTLESLIETYHASVGSNCVLELGMAVDHTGVVPADQVQLATQFGTWVKACYGSPVVLWTATDSGGGSAVTLTLQRPTTIDRVSIGEDLSFGQLIRMYKISVRESAGVAWRPFSEGTGVGNKKIDISAKPMVVQALLLNVTQAVGVPHIKRFAAFAPCAS